MGDAALLTLAGMALLILGTTFAITSFEEPGHPEWVRAVVGVSLMAGGVYVLAGISLEPLFTSQETPQ